MTTLKGRHILVTRPSPAGEALCAAIQQLGGIATYLPTLAFKPPKDSQAFEAAISVLGEQEWLIFISPQAVRASIPAIRQALPNLPPKVKFAAVGGGTAQALQEAGYIVTACPLQEWSSEGLLELPVFQSVQDTCIALIRGEGGRELLANTLTARGARLLQVIAYQRVLPKIEVAPYLEIFSRQPLDAIVCSSFEGVHNLKVLMGEPGWLMIKATPLIVMSERIKLLAQDLGFQTIWVARNASHEAVLSLLTQLSQ